MNYSFFGTRHGATDLCSDIEHRVNFRDASTANLIVRPPPTNFGKYLNELTFSLYSTVIAASARSPDQFAHPVIAEDVGPDALPARFRYPTNILKMSISHVTTFKIFYVIGSLDLGGTERHISLITPHLKRRGWEPTIYCLTGRGAQADDVENNGVRVIGPPSETKKTQNTVGKLFRLIASSAKLFAMLVSERPSIVHFYLPAGYLIGAPIAIAARTRIRIMSRRSLNLYQLNHPILRRFEKRLHSYMQAVLANSKAVFAELRKEVAGATPIELIYNGVELPSTVIPTGATGNASDSKKLTLILVANLIPYKGHADLVQALSLVSKQLPPDWTLLCVGRDDGLGVLLAEKIRNLGLEGHIHFLGPRSDVGELLASADIGILCSHEEGFSNSILEGMAVGLPMIVTDVGGNAEAVVDQETGLVVPARDPAALGTAIAALASNPKLRQLMGMAARHRVEKNFSLARCVENYDALYRRLLAKFAGPHRALE